MPRIARCEAVSLLELLFVLGLASTIVGVSVPAITNGLEATRTLSAARQLAFRLRLARADAVGRSRAVGLRFESGGAGGWRLTPYVDGDGDGIRTGDISTGVDPPVGPVERLSDRFPGVEFGIMPGVRAIASGRLDRADPVVIGRTDILTFTPKGTATSGTLYLHGRRMGQYAVRVLGVTGRVRLLEYSFAEERWRVR